MAKNTDQPEVAATPAKGTAEAQAKAKPAKTKKPLSISANFITLLVVVGIFSYLIFASWQAFQAPADATDLPQAVATPSIPELKLNQANKRQAPVITVDPNSIGKTDPFTK